MKKKSKAEPRKGAKPAAMRNRKGTWETDLFTTFGSKAGRFKHEPSKKILGKGGNDKAVPCQLGLRSEGGALCAPVRPGVSLQTA